MNDIYEQFSGFLYEEEREKAVTFILDKLQAGEIDVIDLYTNILTPSLNQMKTTSEEQEISIWKEHIRTAVVRTIVECCYPYVLEKRNQLNCDQHGTVIVLCPPEEYHDLGARMVADFFTICGYHSIYVGSNTPYEDIFNVLHVIRPVMVAISVSNYYNLVVTKKIIEDIRSAIDYPFTIVVGGNAFNEDRNSVKLVRADYYAATFEDIKRIAESGVTL